MENDYPIPESAVGEEIMELVWQNGAVVVQGCRGGQGGDAVRELRSSCEDPFMREDETASWLQYALDESSFDRDSYVDLFNSPPPPRNNITAIVQPAQDPKIPPRLHNFMPSSRLPSSSRIGPMRKPSETTARGSTVVESNETPAVGAEVSSAPVNTESVTPAALGGINPVTDMESIAVKRQHSLTSSSGGSGASVDPSPPPPQKLETEAAKDDDRKRKGREDEDSEYQSEETEFETTKVDKKQSPGLKRYRSAEIHNLSERKRRDRINEKMKALQDLIPGSNKTDKASMLDDAIHYFKSLQMQVQMMSNMGCSMVPMMYTGMQQQYMHAMGMGMGMNRPIAPYPPVLSPPTMPNPAATVARMGLPSFHLPAPFPLPQVPVPDPSRIQVSNQADPNDPRARNFVDPYPQYLGLQQAQDRAVGQNATKPSTNK